LHSPVLLDRNQLLHTHATELLRGGLNMAYVQKRLGHAQIQTTMKTYAHLKDKDLKAGYLKTKPTLRDAATSTS